MQIYCQTQFICSEVHPPFKLGEQYIFKVYLESTVTEKSPVMLESGKARYGGSNGRGRKPGDETPAHIKYAVH